jgi:hypothetical protein
MRCHISAREKPIMWHHEDPDQREFLLGSNVSFGSARWIREIEKCIPVCHKCHYQYHRELKERVHDAV